MLVRGIVNPILDVEIAQFGQKGVDQRLVGRLARGLRHCPFGVGSRKANDLAATCIYRKAGHGHERKDERLTRADVRRGQG